MFKIHFSKFNDEFYNHAIEKLTVALNQKNKPQQIVDDIIVEELDLGTLPPAIEILEIGELDLSRFRGIFRITYSGDAFIVIRTKIQANPFVSKRGVAANAPLVVPIKIRISRLRIKGIVGLVIDKSKGITVSMKNEPLESVLISSSFDETPMIANYLQNEIEQKLQLLLTDEIPRLIHEYSLKNFNQEEDEVVEEVLSASTSDQEESYELTQEDLLNMQKRFISINEKFEEDKAGFSEITSISDTHSILSNASTGIVRRTELPQSLSRRFNKSKSMDSEFATKRPSVDKSVNELHPIKELNKSQPAVFSRRLSNLLMSNQSLSPFHRNYENSMFKASPIKNKNKSVYSERTSTMSRRSTDQMTLVKPKVRLKKKRVIDLERYFGS
eukprot:NODE_38_length_30618_cov_0.377142.p6 type:complete len:386 gc:universal NODE_38_length_30618_cov_0.377142:27522-28679(+)